MPFWPFKRKSKPKPRKVPVRRIVRRRGYEGASTDERWSGWRTTGSSAVSAMQLGLTTLRARSRHLVRNEPYAAGAIEKIVGHVVQSGIWPVFEAHGIEDKDERQAVEREVREVWRAWIEDRPETTGQESWLSLQRLIVRAMLESGDVFIRRRPRKSTDRLPVPLQVQVLEADFCDHTLNRAVGQKSQNIIVQGIEHDATESRVAYHLHRVHPGESLGVGGWLTHPLNTVRVPADSVAHVWEALRPGQVRGLPWLTPVIVKMREYGTYEDAELVRKRIEACFVAFVEGNEIDAHGDSDNPSGLGPSAFDANGDVLEEVEPGIIHNLYGAQQVKFGQPASTGGAAEWARIQTLGIATGARLPHATLNGDFKGASYSSLRAGRLEWRPTVLSLQDMLVRKGLRQIVSWWLDLAVMSGAIPEGGYRVRWAVPRWESVDRGKEADADLKELRSGGLTWAAFIRRDGNDPDEQLQEHAAYIEKMEQLDVRFDSIPKHTARSGIVQSDASPEPLDPPADPAAPDGAG